MKNRYSLLLLCCCFAISIFAQNLPNSYYLPDISYNPAIPTPQSVLGYQIGDWHVSHDQLVMYMRELAKSSDRISLEEYARSYEHRPLLLLTVTSPANHSNLSNIKEQHQALCDPERSKKVNIDALPAVLYQGFSIHGNEPSGGNASLMVAYYLAAAQGKEIEDMLNNVVILLDPCYNPDGFHRFSTWVNSHKSKNLSSDPSNREFDEAWPRGRTNHYWFDLNRDWLLAQHPESQGRVRNYHIWKPNVLTDHHEMGSNSTFFFQPGIPSRTHPYTPAVNQSLTAQIANHHAKALDKIGSLYYSKEDFDDFYYGKGSAYPDANGGVGILFEQGSSRGHLQETANGLLTFPFTIRNQFTAALSTIKGTFELRTQLLDYQRNYYNSALSDANKDPIKAYIIGEKHDKMRLFHFLQLLQRHQIKVHALKEDFTKSNTSFSKNHAYVIPMQQAQYRLIKSMFEPMTSFKDSLFYDVSTWQMPMAFNIEYMGLKNDVSMSKILGTELKAVKPPTTATMAQGQYNYAYCFEWDEYYAPNLLNALLQAGLRAKFATKKFTAKTAAGEKDFNYGTIMILAHNQKFAVNEVKRMVTEAAQKNSVPVFDIETGLSSKGIDLGSRNFVNVEVPKVMLMIGDGVSSYDAGEVWHLLDQRYDMQLSKVEAERVSNIDLNRYTCIVMVNGGYSRLGKNGTEQLKDWVSNGGTLIVTKRAIRWAKSNGLTGVSFKTAKEKAKTTRRPYGSRSKDQGAQYIGGSIFEANLDLTNPICYGYRKETLPLFRQGTLFLNSTKNAYASPVVYTKKPLLSGYISKRNLEVVKNSVAVAVSGVGGGKVICMTDNPNFGAYWYGTNKLLANAIFFGAIINNGSRERVSGGKEEEVDEVEDGHGHQH